MTACMLDSMGVNLEALPDIAPMLKSGVSYAQMSQQRLGQAPPIVRRRLLFPYLEGAAFVHFLRHLGPSWSLVNDVWSDLPDSTHQILHPLDYLTNRSFPARIQWPSSADPDGWKIVAENTLGEFQIGVLLEQSGKSTGRLAGWKGDRYRVYQNGADRCLIWYSTWRDADTAGAFAAQLTAIYPPGLDGVRYTKIEQRKEAVALLLHAPSRLGGALWDLAWQAEVSVPTRAVKVHLTANEYRLRLAHAPRMPVDARKMRAAGPSHAQFTHAGQQWSSTALGVSLTQPDNWQLNATRLPPVVHLIGRTRRDPACIFMLQSLPSPDGVALEQVEAGFLTGLKAAASDLTSQRLRPPRSAGRNSVRPKSARRFRTAT